MEGERRRRRTAWTCKGTFESGTVCAPAGLAGLLHPRRRSRSRTARTSSATTPRSAAGARTGCEVFGGGLLGARRRSAAAPTTRSWCSRTRFRTPTPGVLHARRRVSRRGTRPTARSASGRAIHGATEEGRSFRSRRAVRQLAQRPPVLPEGRRRAVRPGRPTAQRPHLPGGRGVGELADQRELLRVLPLVGCAQRALPSSTSTARAASPTSSPTAASAHGSGAGELDSARRVPPGREQRLLRSQTSCTRTDSIFLTTDPARMKRFWEKEIELPRPHRRQTSRACPTASARCPSSATTSPRPAPAARASRPTAPSPGAGAARATCTCWSATAQAPTVFPNLDLPAGHDLAPRRALHRRRRWCRAR